LTAIQTIWHGFVEIYLSFTEFQVLNNTS